MRWQGALGMGHARLLASCVRAFVTINCLFNSSIKLDLIQNTGLLDVLFSSHIVFPLLWFI